MISLVTVKAAFLLGCFAQVGTHLRSPSKPFRSDNNAYRGRFHRVITFNSPHNGSTLLRYLLTIEDEATKRMQRFQLLNSSAILFSRNLILSRMIRRSRRLATNGPSTQMQSFISLERRFTTESRPRRLTFSRPAIMQPD